jgi:nitrate/TMAO reductase-like tetraheme cytochrome c subunit
MNRGEPQCGAEVRRAARRAWRKWAVLAAVVFTGGLGTAASAEPALKPEPGGLVPHPVITNRTTGRPFTIQWRGLAGPYQVERSQTLLPGSWKPVGAPTFDTTVSVPGDDPRGFLRVKTNPAYAGAETCLDCHPAIHNSWSQTVHAGALRTLEAIGQDRNATCLPCHTVGHGLDTGFTDPSSTPLLASVQCENCHGPAFDHAQDPLGTRPPIVRAAEVCGGCHNGFHHPTYDEWMTSKHTEVTPTVAASLLSTNSVARMQACGPCHSGAVRLALLANRPLPSPEEAASTAITCAVCHDPHQQTANPSQLRNPIRSTDAFSYSTAATNSFAAQYKPAVNVCGQCHNMRGATWQDTDRYPHYSPQYNIMIGNAGLAPEGITVPQSKHRDQPRQCAGCHVHGHEPASPSAANPVYKGHDFQVSLQTCTQCHDEIVAELLWSSAQARVQAMMNKVQSQLETWAATKSDPALRTKYGKLAWEYNTPGHLSNPAGDAAIRGPTRQEQVQVPDAIKQARFNLYLVYQDKSKGVHNRPYVLSLLTNALDKVTLELQNP